MAYRGRSFAASSYKDYVLAYDIMNEPKRLLPGGWGPAADFVTVSQMQTFVKNSASYIYTYGASWWPPQRRRRISGASRSRLVQAAGSE
jgi:hypothetical protein